MKITKSLLILFYVLTIGVMCRYAIKHSDYDLDILLYTACVIENDYVDKSEVHKTVYEMAQNELGSAKFHQYTDSTHSFRYKLYSDSKTFMNLLPYYKIKGFYILVLKGGYHFGISPILFSTYVNLFCYVIVALLLLVVLTTHLDFYKGFTIAYLSLLLPTFTDTLKSNTPDLLAATLFLLGVFLLLKEQHSLRYLSILFFTLLVFCRNEHIIFIGIFCLSGIFLFQGNYPKKYFLYLGVASLISYLLLSNIAGGSSWKELYKLTNLPPEDIHSPIGEISMKEYFLGFRRIPNNIFYCEVSLILLFSILPLLSYRSTYKQNIFFLLLISNLGFLIIRIMLLPDITNRYFCGSFLISVICYFVLLYNVQLNSLSAHHENDTVVSDQNKENF